MLNSAGLLAGIVCGSKFMTNICLLFNVQNNYAVYNNRKNQKIRVGKSSIIFKEKTR